MAGKIHAEAEVVQLGHMWCRVALLVLVLALVELPVLTAKTKEAGEVCCESAARLRACTMMRAGE